MHLISPRRLTIVLIAAVITSAWASAFAFELTALTGPGNDPPLAPEIPDDPPGIPASASAARSVPLGGIAGPLVPFVQVNIDEKGMNILGDAANEPSIAIDPTAPNRMVIGWRQFDTVKSNFRQAGWGYSHDGGRTWTFPGVLEPGVFRSDPVLGSDSAGAFYYCSLQGNFLCDMFLSTDGGVSFGEPNPAFGGDKQWFTIDRTGLRTDGDIHLAWSAFAGCCNNDTFTQSYDGGFTYTQPVEIPMNPIFGTLAVGPAAEIYTCGRLAQDAGSFAVAKVSDRPSLGGPEFEFAVEVDLGGAMTLGQGPNPAGLLGQAQIDVNRSDGPDAGHVYLLCSVNPPGDDPLDVHIVRSTDGGISWSDPVRINDDPMDNLAWQWFGTMSIAPSGRLDVIWNDTRNDPTTTFSEVFYSFSTDGGETWSPNVALTPPFNHFLGYPNQNKLGDYYHMISDDVGASLAFAATFNGEQDVFFMRIGDYDCNTNGVGDAIDLADATSLDCNCNGIPDECEIAAETELDTDSDGVLDACEAQADFNGDGIIGPADLATLLALWGPCSPREDCSADISPPGGDGTIGPADLAALLANWGACG